MSTPPDDLPPLPSAAGAKAPGREAEEQASRRARKIDRLRREAEAMQGTHSAVEAALDAEMRRQRAWSAGAEGERMVASALETLGRYGWTALHDVHWPGRPLANVDHIAIGPGGVVIIDAKNWSGDVRWDGTSLRQNGYRRDREVAAVAGCTAAVTALLAPAHRTATTPVICLAGQDQPPVRSQEGVTVVGLLQLADHLVSLPHRLSPYEVADLGRNLFATLGGPTSPSVMTTGTFAKGRRPKARRRPARAEAHPEPFTMRQPAARRQSRPPRSRPPNRRRRRSDALVGGLLKLGAVAVAGWLFLQWVQSGALTSVGS